MKRLTLLLTCFLLLTPVASADQTVSGDVFGVWMTGEKITVVDHIRVPPGQSLIIEPDVLVVFTGRYKFTVEGLLRAEGTRDAWITLTRADPTEQSKWRGFRFDGAEDASLLQFCDISYCKGDGAYPDVRGGAVWIKNCSPTIRYCKIHDCYSHNDNYNGAGGGVMVEEGCYSVIEFNHIYDNQADSGGGICAHWECKPVIHHNIIENNKAFYMGGGIGIGANTESTICENLIIGNEDHGWGGGGISLWSATGFYGTYSHVYNNFIVNNISTEDNDSKGGGGIYSRYDTSYIYNNTLAGNQAVRGGGLYVITHSHLQPYLSNSILWGNTATKEGSEIHLREKTGSAIIVEYCDIAGGWPGTGNIDADPLFVDMQHGDCHLSYISPCIDKGNKSFPYVPLEDYDGNPRIAYGVLDMGADEFYTHLYYTGDATPGGSVELKFIDLPGSSPVGFWIAFNALETPLPGAYGDWWLLPPMVGAFFLGSIPTNGVYVLPGTIPVSPPGPYSLYLQALVGMELTNMCEMQVK